MTTEQLLLAKMLTTRERQRGHGSQDRIARKEKQDKTIRKPGKDSQESTPRIELPGKNSQD
jgi:hypothetical protein